MPIVSYEPLTKMTTSLSWKGSEKRGPNIGLNIAPGEKIFIKNNYTGEDF